MNNNESSTKLISLILTSVLLNAGAQLFLKKGMTIPGPIALTFKDIGSISYEIRTNHYVIIAIFCYISSVGLWMVVLLRAEVSFAYPFLSIGYVVVAVAGYLFFHESMNMFRIIGIFLICTGIVFISKSN